MLAELAGRTRCVCQLQDAIDVAPNVLSYHLKVLRDAGLVTTSRRSRWIDYRTADEAGPQLLASLAAAGLTGDQAVASDGPDDDRREDRP